MTPKRQRGRRGPLGRGGDRYELSEYDVVDEHDPGMHELPEMEELKRAVIFNILFKKPVGLEDFDV